MPVPYASSPVGRVRWEGSDPTVSLALEVWLGWRFRRPGPGVVVQQHDLEGARPGSPTVGTVCYVVRWGSKISTRLAGFPFRPYVVCYN